MQCLLSRFCQQGDINPNPFVLSLSKGDITFDFFQDIGHTLISRSQGCRFRQSR